MTTKRTTLTCIKSRNIPVWLCW